jgi:hypothetical protein
MQFSSRDFITVTNEFGVSGRFIELARTGRLAPVSKAIWDRSHVARELAEIEAKLRACNDPATLAEFAIRCSTRTGDFISRLRQVVAKLEAQKSQVLAKLRKIDEQANKLDLGVEWAVTAAPMISLVPRHLKKADRHVVERNEVIDEHLGLAGREVCKVLDQHFVRDGQCYDHLPKTWALRHDVHTFTEAYRHPRCKNLVEKMISVRRARSRGYPGA